VIVLSPIQVSKRGRDRRKSGKREGVFSNISRVVHLFSIQSLTFPPSLPPSLPPSQAEMPSGRWRARHGQTRIYGCTQWHMLHYTMAYEMAMHPEVRREGGREGR
jgi:hypothetical protein